MPETSSNGATPGATADEAIGTAVVAEKARVDRDRYRPKASTAAVHDEIVTSLSGVVSQAVRTVLKDNSTECRYHTGNHCIRYPLTLLNFNPDDVISDCIWGCI